MQKEEVSYTFYVLAGFVLLFMIFLLVQPPPETTGLISLNLNAAGGKLPLIIIGVTAILALGLALMSYKHFKKKKAGTTPATPTQPALSNEELTQLFPENNAAGQPATPSPAPLAAPQPSISPPQSSAIQQQPKQQPMANLQELKSMIIGLLAQGQTKQQILEQLQSKGFTTPQITKAVDEINLEKLIQYVKNALSQGFQKEQVTKILLESGWQQEMIDKTFSSSP